MNYCRTIDKIGIVGDHKTLKGFLGSQKLLDRNQCFEMLKRKKVQAKRQSSWKKIFDSGIVVSKKARQCTECRKEKNTFYVVDVRK